ncbi:MAG: HAD hydrolase family protein [Panacagrimonas sp.]
MGKPYSKELDQFPETAAWAADQDVKSLERYFDRWTGDHVAIIGSGGSYSAAVAVAVLRELATASPTNAVTPLQFASLSRRLPDTHAFLLSAEGKNRDILYSAKQAIAADHDVGALTLTTSSPLLELSVQTRAMRVFALQMPWTKDGYLATNSLLATVLLFYKAFCGEGAIRSLTATMLDRDVITARRVAIGQLSVPAIEPNDGVLILHGEGARTFAIDLESKISEAALSVASVVDLRQFAHGRHLQLSTGRLRPFVIVAFGPSEQQLAEATIQLFPKGTRIAKVALASNDPAVSVVEGILEASYFMELLAKTVPYDVGDPPVGPLGRALHGIDPELLTDSVTPLDHRTVGSRRKAPASKSDSAAMSRALSAGEAYVQRLENARLKAIVCDFDGTLCRAENRYGGIDSQVLKRLLELCELGMIVAIASGRGDSLHENLSKVVPKHLQERMLIGLYSGSYILRLSDDYQKPKPNPAFQTLFDWMEGTAYGCPDKPWEKVKGGQFSLRVTSPREAKRLYAGIAAWLRQTQRYDWRVYRSGHSVDVLDSETSKLSVLSAVSREFGLDPEHDILCIGDCGHEEGNDYES